MKQARRQKRRAFSFSEQIKYRAIIVFDFLPQTILPVDQRQVIIDLIGRQITASIAHKPAPAILHHYTDAAGLKGIVESGTLRATHIAYMNDASEYLHAVRLLRDSITDNKARRTNVHELAFLNEIEAPVANTRPQDTGPYFVICFSEKENSLNQWRAYGRGEGGYSIGFDTSRLAIALSKHTSHAILAPTLYERTAQAKLVDSVLEGALEEYKKLAETVPEESRSSHLKEWAHHFLWFASGLAPLMKNPSFEEESEWRVVYLLRAKRETQFLPKSTGLTPIVSMKLGEPQTFTPLPQPLPNDTLTSQPDALPIVSLWSGPGRLSELSLLAGRTLLEKHGYDSVKLFSSQIPFRVS